jgi:hypothetical protein
MSNETWWHGGGSIKRKAFMGKRLESEILRGPKIKSPETTGLFIFKLVVPIAHKLEPYFSPKTVTFPLYI